MFGSCNINKTDRINRSIIGIIIFLATYFGASQYFFFILGGVLLLEGLIGWCSIPLIIQKLKIKKKKI